MFTNIVIAIVSLVGLIQFFNVIIIKKTSITPLKRRQMELEIEVETSQQTQVMLEFAPLAISMYDKNFDVFGYNRESVKMFGKTTAEYEEIADMLPPTQPDGSNSMALFNEMMNKAFTEGYARAEMICRRCDGKDFPAEITWAKAKYKGESVVIEYVTDLSVAKDAMASKYEAEHLLELAAQESAAKSRFLARMSHEIRTPINAVQGISDAQLQKDELDTEMHEAFSRIKSSANLLCAIVNDILDLSKIEVGNMELTLTEYDTAGMIADIVRLNTVGHEHIGNHFELKVDENLPARLVGDETRLKQIFNNLLSNAFKYTDNGTVTLTFAFAHADLPELSELVVHVQDTGCGMVQEQVDAVLEREFTSITSDIDGSGLGLMITHSLIDMMNGTIEMHSTPGEGTVVTVHLPQEYVDTEIIGKRTARKLQAFNFDSVDSEKEEKIEYVSMSHGKILIVDDIATNLFVCENLLKPYDLRIDTATSGFAAIEKVQIGAVYDIIFMDYMMPQMDGVETMRKLREIGYTHPIITLTANAVVGTREAFLEYGFDEFITKPIDIHELDTILKTFVRPKPSAKKTDKQEKPDADSALKKVVVYDIENAITVLKDFMCLKHEAAITNLRLYTTTVHGMKSALSYVGETDLSSTAYELEKAGDQGEIDRILRVTPTFIGELKRVLKSCTAEIAETSAEVSASELTNEDIGFLRVRLELIKKACADYNMVIADAVLSELTQKRWTNEIQAGLDTISMGLLCSEFDKVTEAVNALLNA
jgi:signal transduction histidine kinase/FixJ family two-component response regulator/HPt (histidine-containing phosphotransfer) domain-containing protein